MKLLSPLLAILGIGAVAAHPHAPGSLETRQSCSGPVETSPQAWWRAAIGHNGTAPTSTDSTFQYYRTVVQYGADNTGVQDSSDAFNWAIEAWSRTGNTVTTRPAYVYIPPGKYRIKKSIQMLVTTYLIGDAVNPPTLIADSALGTSPVINGYDSHQGDGSATKNFYMAVRNIVIDTNEIGTGVQAVGLDWSVSQGCSLTNVKIRMPNYSSHIGITMNAGGSGILISDSQFEGGAIGIKVNGQQYQFKNLSFNGCNVGISVSSVFVAVVQGSTFMNCNFGIDMSQATVGTVSLIDSSVQACNAGVNQKSTGYGENSLIIDNFQVTGATAVKSSDDGSTLRSGSVPFGQTWVMGYVNSNNLQKGTTYSIDRPNALLSGDKYFTAPLPQYEKYALDQFISLKGDPSLPVYGDNSHDDGSNINAILQKYKNCKIIFVPQGVYLTQQTIYVPPGTRLVGETLSIFNGNGSRFWNPDDPQPILKVGNSGEVGIAQISDITVEAADVLQGATLVQINMAGSKPGDVGIWSSVFRVGGTKHSLTNTNCGGSDPASCKAAFALMHVTSTASAYLENVWGWVADHSLDGGAAQNIAVGRGALIESTKPTWLVGTSFEHCVLYQYNLHNAQNVYISLQQTEAPYWQGEGTPQRAPSPWSVKSAYGDPDFSNCAAQGQANNDRCFRAWGHYMTGSSKLVIHGSALWVFFNKMNDNQWQNAQCENTGGNCMTNQAFADGAKQTYWFGLSSKSSTNLLYDKTGGEVWQVVASDNPGSWGGVLAAYLRDTGA
ncbi:Glucan endo-1,3-beta-glucosidase [Colletotrichum siamense]|uniref:Glucan endo-1,3-beta-glucosidase n=1 Tax=Colletotrichum siamense TaxID=690259 RepID=UPI0018731C82|nr:Glucan endo-1,3-beta-glucosidase [Colletotrichum siamense]KAF5486932.1 Glucan endo-1,3-beta-glucosidase [Colletotrichum siamense]